MRSAGAVILVLVIVVVGALAAYKVFPGVYPVLKAMLEKPEADPLASRHPFARHVVDSKSPNDPWAKAIADLDGDGIPDVIVGGGHGPMVMYAAGQKERIEIAAAGSYYTESGIAVGDIDRDGDPDISFGGVWMENPRPRGNVRSIWPVHDLGVEKMNHNIEIADLNNDGYPDMIMRGESDSQIVILVQDGSGEWNRRTIDPGFGRNGLAVADVDGDAFLDVIAPGLWMKNPGRNLLADEWKVYRFGEWEAYAAIDAEDVDGDGRIDIALSVSEKAGKVSWFKNPPDPTQRWEEHIIDAGPVDCAHALKIVDVDKDGIPDVATSEFRGDGRLLVYYQNKKDRNNPWVRQVLGKPFLHNLVVGDLDNDGDQDFAGAVTFGVGNVEVWENRITTLDSGASSLGKILLFWKTDAAFHGSIPDALRAVRDMAEANGVNADATADAHVFTDEVLAQYKAVVFLSTQGNIFDSEQKSVFERYIRSGGGFAGIHSAADTEQEWEWYRGLVGAFYGGSHSEIVKSVVHTENSDHPSTKGLPSQWKRMDEWYNFSPNPRAKGINILLNVDEMSYEGGNMKGDHPVAWFHEYDGGRSWYTAGGASHESWADRHFKNHVWGGIQYAARF